MKIGIVGSGISGLVAAYHLSQRHAVTVFEANAWIGGHTNTVDVNYGGECHSIDTGFIVFNDRTYPNFIHLLQELQVPSVPTSMGFCVSSEPDDLEYSGSGLAGLFAQRRNLLRPGHYRMIGDILRFNRQAPALASELDDSVTVAEFLRRHRYSTEFAQRYLLPMGAAIWSCPVTTFESFPVRFIVDFYQNHGLLSFRDRPTWRVIPGGSQRYVEALTKPFRDCIRLNSAVQRVRRRPQGVDIITEQDTTTVDEVVMACHSDQTLRLLGEDVTPTEKAVLESFPYQPNTAVLHTDESVLPKRRQVWSSWNYHISGNGDSHLATLTYNMNILQHLKSKHTFCVTLNESDRIDSKKVLGTYRYSHPIFTVNRRSAQQRHPELIRNHRVSCCGAYWGNGFHEDGVNSALAVVGAFQDSSGA